MYLCRVGHCSAASFSRLCVLLLHQQVGSVGTPVVMDGVEVRGEVTALRSRTAEAGLSWSC